MTVATGSLPPLLRPLLTTFPDPRGALSSEFVLTGGTISGFVGAMPSANGGNGTADGRDLKTGQFVKGWKGGPGNPNALRVAQFRQAAIEAVKPEDVARVMATLLASALDGEGWAVKEFLDRTIGKVTERVHVEGDGAATALRDSLKLLLANPVALRALEGRG